VLKGFRDYLPDVMVPREHMLGTVAQVFQSFGFLPLSTPAIEYTDILLGKYGTEGDQLLYRFEDNGGRDVSLRYDLTVPLARVIGQHTELPRPFRRYQIAPVWRAEKPGRGRFREFVQCDVDIVGAPDLLADFECVQVGVAVLQALGVTDFEMRVNDRRILDGLMRRLGIEDDKVQAEVLRTVDKLPKVGWDAMMTELREKVALDAAGSEALHTFLHGSLDQIDDSVVDMTVAGPGVDSLRQLLAYAEEVGVRAHLGIDLSIARGLDYYTSTIYETFLTTLPGFGSVMSGGRYDGLLGMFSGESVPAVGISLGVDRLLAGLMELGLVSSAGSEPDVFVAVYDEGTCGFAQRIAQRLRADGLRAQLHLAVGQKIAKQFKAAAKVGARFVVVAGPDEAARGEASVKDMRDGVQVALPVAEIAAYVRSR
jgi:histidyl-tRNA synthetase